MKSFIVAALFIVACAASHYAPATSYSSTYWGNHVAAPHWSGYASPWAYSHAPVVIGPNGVPIDTPEVQHARAAHLAAHAQAHHGAVAHWGPSPLVHGGVVDTPEVQHAKALHFAAHAAARAGHHLYKRSLWGGHGYAAPWAYQAAPVIHNGVPVDTPEVQHAKAAHFAAHAAARSGHPVAAAGHYAAHVPVIHNGVPVDTPEVQHAKAAHFAAVAQAQAHSGAWAGDHSWDGSWDDGHYDGHNDGHWDNGAWSHGAHGAIHVPVIHNGVPVETPEVQHAKAAHFAAVAEAKARTGYEGHWNQGHHGW